MSEEIIEQKFQVEGTPTVRVENINGTITVQPGSSGEVDVQAIKRGSQNLPVEIFQEEDGTIVASAKPTKSTLSFLDFGLKKGDVEFNLTVPAETNLVVKTVNCKTDVNGINGEMTLGTVNGSISVNDVSGKLKLDSVNGSISGSKVAGEAVMKSVNGKIIITESDLPALTAGTVSGNIQIDTPIGAGPYTLKTVSGNVKIKSEGSLKGRVHFKSVNGQVRVNNKRVATNGSMPGVSGRKVFEFGENGPEIHFKSVSGSLDFLTDSVEDIKMFASADVETVDPEPTLEPASDQDLMSVLDQISSGELSVDEGISKLQGS
jgi:DUF4097 and DUF4098 domain-containing protein YvlB